jgi:N-acetylmuramoyl-L-alanine amidase
MIDPVGTASVYYLGLVVYREARGEIMAARVAVAYTVMNRAARPKWWGSTIQSVIFKKWQYSSMTDPNDPQVKLHTLPTTDDPAFLECLTTACEVLGGVTGNPVPGADSYYDDSIAAPNWTAGARFVAKIGKLNFYDVDHDYEAPVTGHA